MERRTDHTFCPPFNPLGERRAEAGTEERFPLTRGIAAGADAPSQ